MHTTDTTNGAGKYALHVAVVNSGQKEDHRLCSSDVCPLAAALEAIASVVRGQRPCRVRPQRTEITRQKRQCVCKPLGAASDVQGAKQQRQMWSRLQVSKTDSTERGLRPKSSTKRGPTGARRATKPGKNGAAPRAAGAGGGPASQEAKGQTDTSAGE